LVSTLPLAHPTRSDTALTLSVWDFGGQDIYHATHQFFLTDESLFVLVWNSGEGTERGRLRYWLNIITSRAPHAPVLIVATHTADRPADISITAWQQEYPQIVGFWPVDCATAAGVRGLQTAIVENAVRLPLMGVSWPRSWDQAATILSSPDQPAHASIRHLWESMAEAGVVDGAAQHTLATALHNRGQILYYADDDDLADTVILDPQWLNQHISKVLDSHTIQEHAGILTRHTLTEAWPDLDRPQREHLLALMDRFDVSYRIRDSHDDALAVVVSWLPAEAPDYSDTWASDVNSNDHEIRVVYQLPMMPPGIPGWFLARSHRFATDLRWRSGAVVRHPDGLHVGLIRSLANEVELTVRGPLPAGFFSVLDDGLNLTLDRYPGLPITRLIPCHTHGPCPTRFDYAKLMARLQDGRTTVVCAELEDTIDIASLLLGVAPTNRDRDGQDLQQLLLNGFTSLRDAIVDNAMACAQEFMRIRTAIQKTQQAVCPSVFTLTNGRKRIFRTKHVLRLYCEEPGCWHPLANDDGCYEITQLADWLRTAGPYMTSTLQLLRSAVPFVGTVLGLAAHELQDQLKDDLELTSLVLDSVEMVLKTDGVQIEPNERGTVATQHASADADFRVLTKMLEQLDPSTKWGGLSLTTTPEGINLYLCYEHQTRYR
jgi:internalin A